MSEFTRTSVSWAVEYSDGTLLEQHKKREQDNVEVPLRTIDWGKVVRVRFASAEMEYAYTLPQLPDEIQWSMRMRHYRLTGGVDAEIIVMILIASLADQEISEDTVSFALFVTPDGIVHFCDQFNCSHIPDYYHGKFTKRDVTVPQQSWRTQVEASVELKKE